MSRMPRRLFIEKSMLPLRRQDREEAIMTDVLQVRMAELLAPGPRRFGHADAVFLDELAIDGLWRPCPRESGPSHTTNSHDANTSRQSAARTRSRK